MRFLLTFPSLLLLLFSASSASAHGDAPSLEAEVGEYFIDIGYGDLAPGRETEFDIDLLLIGPPVEYADFASVDVRVTKDGTEIVAGSVENDDVHIPTFAVTFPDAGGYDIDVRFLDEQEQLIVARTFHLEVPPASVAALRGGLETLHYVIAAGLLALSIGIAGYSVWQRYKIPKKYSA